MRGGKGLVEIDIETLAMVRAADRDDRSGIGVDCACAKLPRTG